jgi:hypothetical protein
VAEHDSIIELMEARKLEVAKQLLAVGRMFNAFLYDGEQRPSRAIDQAMKEAERAFADGQYDRSERLAKVVALMIKREAPKFAADPMKYVETRRELHA